MKDLKGQLTFRGVLIGCLGCTIITAASIYMALRMGALPWPIVFAAIISLFFLKAVSKNTSTLNEANVTHTVMSAGAMVAGGLAFTIPGAWMLGLADEISLVHLTVIALAGVALGLICTALLRKHFVEEAQLEFPIGEAAAQTLIAGESGGKTGRKLFGAMGIAGVFAFLRDGLAVIPAMIASLPIPGVTFGIYASPMLLSVGFLVGTGAVAVWFLGAVLGNFGIIAGGTAAGFFDTATAQGIVSSLGMGVMMGSGFAVITKDILPKGAALLRKRAEKSPQGVFGLTAASTTVGFAANPDARETPNRPRLAAGLVALGVAAVALGVSMALSLPPVVSMVVVLLAFVTCAMSAQSVGQTGIDPMEIFGLIVLLLVAAFANVAQVQLFFIAALIAVACGLAGDVMNDFKAGHIIGTNPKAQIIGQAIGGIVGALVSVAVMHVLLSAYGPEAFGPGAEFVAAQASVVATMVSGIPHVGAFAAGLVLGFVLYLAKFPSMMLGLGVYLPFYMSLTAFLGAMAKVVYDFMCKRRADKAGLVDEERARELAASNETGLVVASGLLGGESIVGIVLALAVAAGGLFA